MQGNIKATESVGDLLDKRWGFAFHPLSSPTMPPRISKNKTPAKATVIAASASNPTTAPRPSSSEFTSDFLDLYNDILAAKNDLLDSNPGRAHQTAILELGACLVSCTVYLNFQADFKFLFFRKDWGPFWTGWRHILLPDGIFRPWFRWPTGLRNSQSFNLPMFHDSVKPCCIATRAF